MSRKAQHKAERRRAVPDLAEDDARPSLARFIRQCRLSQKLTLRQIEKMTADREELKDLKYSHLTAIEKGRYIPRFDDILTLSSVLNVPVACFEERLKLDMMGPQEVGIEIDWNELMHLGRETMETGNYSGALPYFRKALAVAEGLGGEARWAEAKLYAANCLRRLGLLRNAKEEIETLLTCRELGDELVVKANFVLGEIYRHQKNFHLALPLLEFACRKAEEVENGLLQGKVYHCMANLYADLGRFDEAASLYRKALRWFKDLKQTRLQIMIEIALGICMAEKGVFDEGLDAIRCLESGLELARKGGYRRETSLAHLALAKTHFNRKTYAAARVHAGEAKQVALEEQYTDVLFQSIYYLWEVARKDKRKRLAAVYRERLKQLSSRLEPALPEVHLFEEYERKNGVKP